MVLLFMQFGGTQDKLIINGRIGHTEGSIPGSLAGQLTTPATSCFLTSTCSNSSTSFSYITGVLYQVCGISSVSISRPQALLAYLTAIMSQGLLPTLMIAYVGLDLGVNTSVVTNSFAPKFELRKSLESQEVDAEQGRDIESIRELPEVLNIRRHDDEEQNV
jgi:hypothetical protein